MSEYDSFFTNRELYVIDQPDAQQLKELCCAVSGGKLWATDKYLTERYGYGRMLLIYVERGAMFLEYDGQRYDVKSGEAFFIDCDPPQAYGTSGESCVLTFVHFMGGASDYLFKCIAAKSGYVFSGYCAKLVKNCIDETVAITQSHAQNKVEKFSSILTQTLFGLLTHESSSDPLFEKAAYLIREAVAQNAQLNVEDIAREIGYSKFYFTKKFTQSAGVPPYEFIMREKMALAKNMLINTSVAIGDIALKCGFFDASHMSNCFKKRVNATPLAFRREWKKTI